MHRPELGTCLATRAFARPKTYWRCCKWMEGAAWQGSGGTWIALRQLRSITAILAFAKFTNNRVLHMNHGNLGLIEHNLATREVKLLLPSDMLRILSIENKSRVDGIYYPRSNDGNQGSSLQSVSKSDFVFAPIPFRLWPKAGRIRIRLTQEVSLCIADLSEFLAQNEVSIVHSEYTRSGHYLATWNLVVILDTKIPVSDNDFDVKTSSFEVTTKKLHEIKSKIQEKYKNFLLKDKSDFQLQRIIQVWPLTTLAYFYNYARRMIESRDDPWLYEHFSLACQNGDLVSRQEDDQRFPAILGKITNPNGMSPYTTVYADISTTDITLRVSIIPQESEFRFAEIDVDFVRSSEPDTSRGFCAHITGMLPPSFRVWKLTNFTKVSFPWSEVGGAKILIEETKKPPIKEHQVSDKVSEILKKIRHSEFKSDENQVFNIRADVKMLSSNDLWKEIIRERTKDPRGYFEYDIFLSYSVKNENLAESLQTKLEMANLRCYMAKKELQGDQGADFAERIRDAILTSMEMIILCSPESIKSEWVTTEWGAAWVLKKRITPVIYHLSVNDLPQRLQRLQYVDAHEFELYIKGFLKRKAQATGPQ